MGNRMASSDGPSPERNVIKPLASIISSRRGRDKMPIGNEEHSSNGPIRNLYFAWTRTLRPNADYSRPGNHGTRRE